jgi:SAM-dependent methyltransferase
MTNEPSVTSPHGEPFRFYDNREKYLLFVTTTSEKAVVAERIGRELDRLQPTPPALRVFDAGTGNGTVIANVLRDLHRRMPTVPMVVVGKEFSMEDARLTLATLPGRLAEHPETIFVLTNMFYAESPGLWPRSEANQANLQWWDVALEGSTGHEFHTQINDLEHLLTTGWQTKISEKSGNLVYAKPSVIVLYRQDRAFALHDLIPRNLGGPQPNGYDLVLAAQPYRSRTPAESKVRTVLAPLARSLNPNGRLVVVQSTGHDPGMEIVRRIWPGDEPFATPRATLMKEIDRQLNGDGTRFHFENHDDAQALFTYHLHAMPSEVTNRLSTSTALAAWNAAVYVAQVDEERVAEAMQNADYLQATNEVVIKHGGLWFQDESFAVVRD